MTDTARPPADATWKAVTEQINAFRAKRATAPENTTPAAAIASAFQSDPVGIFLRNQWVAWARWQDNVGEFERVQTLLRVANGKPLAARDALALTSSSKAKDSHSADAQIDNRFDRALWRERLHRIADASNDEERIHVAKSLAPELVQEVADNVVFVVDRASTTSLNLKMLEVAGSTAGLSYATLTMLGPDGLGTTLCECQMPGCGVFFLTEPKRTWSAEKKQMIGLPGKKRRNYCDEHQKEGPRLRNRERASRWRDDRKAAKAKKTKRYTRS